MKWLIDAVEEDMRPRGVVWQDTGYREVWRMKVVKGLGQPLWMEKKFNRIIRGCFCSLTCITKVCHIYTTQNHLDITNACHESITKTCHAYVTKACHVYIKNACHISQRPSCIHIELPKYTSATQLTSFASAFRQ